MTDHAGEPTPRRDFLGTLAASAVALTATACAAPAVASAPAPAQGTAPTPPGTTTGTLADGSPAIIPTQWDNSWFDKLKAKHKAVFEQAQMDYGSAVSFAQRWIAGMRDAQTGKGNDIQAVLVLRHEAVPMVLNDAMWEKYGIGEALKFKTFGETIQKTNPIASAPPPRAGRGGQPAADDPLRPQANIPWFSAHGHITLACNAAFNGFASQTASRVKSDRAAVYAEFKANLLPGVILQPNGIYATLRAQEAGCVYIRAV